MMYEEDTDILYIDPGFQEYLFARYYAFAPSNEMKELCNTLIDQSTTTFRRWSAFRMLYEYSSDKVEVCLFIPFLDRIFKDRDDRDSFLQFIKIGYKELRYTVLDQDLIENYKGEAGVMNQMKTGELNEPKTVILSVILRVLKQFNFVQIVMYSPKLKYKVFVPLIANNDNGENTSSESETFYCTRGGINSIGVRTSDGFVVKKGSVISSKVTKSCPEYVLKKRDQYKKILDDKNTLIDDILFNTPSGAASFVCGSSANGNVEWKNSAGVTIKELDEQQEE